MKWGYRHLRKHLDGTELPSLKLTFLPLKIDACGRWRVSVGKGQFFWCELLVSGSVCLVVCAMFFLFVGVLDPRNKKRELTEDQWVNLERRWLGYPYFWKHPFSRKTSCWNFYFILPWHCDPRWSRDGEQIYVVLFIFVDVDLERKRFETIIVFWKWLSKRNTIPESPRHGQTPTFHLLTAKRSLPKIERH